MAEEGKSRARKSGGSTGRSGARKPASAPGSSKSTRKTSGSAGTSGTGSGTGRSSSGTATSKASTTRKKAGATATRAKAPDEGSKTRAGTSRSKDDEHGNGEFRPTAPSLGPNTVIEREPVEERLARHEQSDVDAMGNDQRRSVVGHSYGPSKTRQLLLYGIFLAVVAVLVIGGKLLVDALDTPVGKNIPNS